MGGGRMNRRFVFHHRALERRARYYDRRFHSGVFRILWIPLNQLFTRNDIIFP